MRGVQGRELAPIFLRANIARKTALSLLQPQRRAGRDHRRARDADEPVEFDLKDFIKDALDSGVLNSKAYVQCVQAGFELADASAALTVDELCIDV